jgi:Na+:H+ antiporter, NhaA family
MKIPPRSFGSAEIRAERSVIARRLVLPAQAFIHTEGYSSLALLFGAVLALAWVNSPWRESYARLWETPLNIQVGSFAIQASLREWVNDGLMAIFFFVVGMEIKRELVEGHLSTPRRAALPILAALGGMVTPALIYLAFNPQGPSSRGWGIPMATDIAFAVGALLLLGDRVPPPMRIFLLALAVADDLGAILVIALVYMNGISLQALAIAAGLFILIAAMRWGGIQAMAAYLPIALLFWAAMFKSGVHATIAGVMLGLATPSRPWFSLESFSESIQNVFSRFRQSLDEGDLDGAEVLVGQIEELSQGTEPPLERRLRKVHPWSSFLILPLFALANSNVALTTEVLSKTATSHVAWGIFLGLFVGKPLGVVGFAWLAVRLRLANLPTASNWSHMVGAGLLAGIGFTVSLFVTELAFHTPLWEAEAKLAILSASILSGLVGYIYLRIVTSSRDPRRSEAEASVRSH